MQITRSHAPRSAAIEFRQGNLWAAAATSRRDALVAGICAILLSACAGMPAVAPAGASDEPGLQARAIPAVQGAAMRGMTARDIFLEWGIAAGGPKPHKKARTYGVARLPLALPDYSATVQEIVANAACRSCEQMPYHDMVVQASNLHGVPSGLIHAVIRKESGYNPGARSRQDARGLMQLTPGTARFMGVDNSKRLYDPQTNIYAGTAYLKYLMHTHATFDQVLAAYNSGPGNVRKYRGVPPFAETRRYVIDVKKYFAATSGDLH